MGGSLGGSSNQTIGFRYYMSILMGVGRGPIDELVQINAGDVRAWPFADGSPDTIDGGPAGIVTAAAGPPGTCTIQYEDGSVTLGDASAIATALDDQVFTIDATNIFGGDKKEGGLAGSLTLMMGKPTQVVPDWIKGLLGGRVPDFRGVCTMFYDGLLTSLNPYPKAWTMRVRRTNAGWDGDTWHPELAAVWQRMNSIMSMNPAHIIYECLTNRGWGRGLSRDAIDGEGTFLSAATRLHDESFGLCIRWNRQDQLGDFVQEIIDHIGGSLYTDRLTGKMCLTLLRGDYDVDDLPTFTYDSGLVSIEENETAARDDIVNEVIVNWTDPIGNEDRQARVQNLASIQTLGSINSTTTSYNGIPTVELALRVAQRDLKANATSLKRYKITLDRRAWRIIPGSVFRISAPDRDINNVILRAGKITENGLSDGKIAVEAVLDVFGLSDSSFVAPEPPQWAPPSRTAVVPTRRYLREGTYRDAVLRLSASDLAALPDTSAAIATMVGKPSNLSQSYLISSRVVGEDFKKNGAEAFAPSAKLSIAVGRYDTVLHFNGGIDLGLITIGGPVQIGEEICRLDDITTTDNVTGTITLGRGCVDTIPIAHGVDEVIYFIEAYLGSDEREYASGETVDVKFLTVTSTQELDPVFAPTDSVDIVARQAKPWPAANLTVNGTAFGNVTTLSPSETMALTWAHRDRTIIQDQLLEHGASGTTIETGATYTVRVYAGLSATSPSRTASGLTSPAFSYTPSMMTSDGVTTPVVFELETVRAGIVSFQKYRFPIARA